jgi:hypothetical protein
VVPARELGEDPFVSGLQRSDDLPLVHPRDCNDRGPGETMAA